MFLIAKGYRILARRFKTPFGEIDIVASRGGVLVCVEEAVEGVTERSKRRIVGAAELRRARPPITPTAKSVSTLSSSRRA